MNRKSSSKKSRGFGFGRTNPTRKSTRRATFEPLETRQLLAVTLPTIGDQVVMTGAPLNLALASTSDHTVSYSVTVGDPSKVTATVPTNNTYLKIHVTDTADNINGDMVFQLFNDLAPKTVAWITSLVTENFYNGLIFHRIMDGFMIQGGAYSTDLHYHSPTSGTIDDEINANLQFTGSGLLAMAKPDGSDGNGAQFFITDGEARWLDFHHTIFGMLVEGASIRDKISAVPKDSNNFPNNFVQITSAQIITDTTDGVLRLSAPIGATGSTLVTVTAKDTTTNETSVKQFNVTLAPDTQDDPPFLTAINPIQTPVNTPITFTLPATDVDGGAIYYKGENTYDVSLTDVPNIKGTTKITLSVNSSTGVVTLTPAADLPPGVYSVRFSVGTSAAAINDAQEVPVYITSSAPTSITLAAASDTGNNSDKITSLNNTSGKTLQFTVNGVTAGNVVQLYADGALIGQANATGTSVTITTDGTTPLTDGTHAITAKQILKSQAVNVGNLSTSADLVSPASASLSVTVDTIAPVFNFTPVVIAKTGIPYTCTASVASPTTGVTFQLTQSPTGMSINSTTGVITWTPGTGQQIDGVAVTVRATDTAGNTADKSYSLSSNSLPVFGTIDPIKVANDGKAVSFTIPATDAEGDPIYYKGSVLTGGSDLTLTVNSSTGVATIKAASTLAVGIYSVKFDIGTSSSNITSSKTVPVYVNPSVPGGDSIAITLVATSDTGYSNSDGITSKNNSSSSSTLQFQIAGVISGLTVSLYSDGILIGEQTATGTTITMTTNGSATILDGTHLITAKQSKRNQTVDVGDYHTTVDLTSDASFATPITINTASLQFNFAPVTTATVGTAYTCQVAVINTTGSNVVYVLTQAPSGMTISSDGLISWTPTASDLTSTSGQNIIIKATAGTNSISTSFTINNHQPTLAKASPAISLGTIAPNSPTKTFTVGSLINNGAGTTTVTDPDAGASSSLGGIALTGITGSGTWEYSLDGNTFYTIPSIIPSLSLLLSKDAKLRYTPDGHTSEQATIKYRAWDGSSGMNGGRVRLSVLADFGVGTAYSTLQEIAPIYVDNAPVLSAAHPMMGQILPSSVFNIALNGTFIKNGSGTTGITDIDPNANLGGIAITGLTGNGKWEYALTSGGNYATLTSLSDAHALLLNKDAVLRYTPLSGGSAEIPTITYRAWDTISGSNNTYVDLSASSAVGGNTSFSSDKDTASLVVNTAPVLVSANPSLGHTDEDTDKVVTVASFIKNGSGTTDITDADPSSVIGGIAITGVVGNGIWAYSLDNGVTYTNIDKATVSESSALLLPKDAKLRYSPDKKSGETPQLTYRAWDTLVGVAGERANLTASGATGGTSSFSSVTDTVKLTVDNVNDAPILEAHTPLIGTTDKNTAITFSLTNTFINHGAGTTIISEVDANASTGAIAIVGFTGGGTWKYSIDGLNFITIDTSTIGDASALLLPANAKLSYQPNGTVANETATITYRAWDGTSDTAGQLVNLSQSSSRGGQTAYSVNTDTAKIVVNDAPVITEANHPSLGTIIYTATKSFNLHDIINNGAGTTIVTDPDPSPILGGIAIIGMTGNGKWEYFLNGTYTTITEASLAKALLLPKDTVMRYTPAASNNTAPSITYLAWDTTVGAPGQQIDLSPSGSTGGTTAFSSVSDTASLTVRDLPSDIVLTNYTIPEGKPIGTTIGEFSSTSTTGGTYSYSLVSGTGDTDNGSFTLSGNKLQSAAVFVTATKSTYTIRVRTTDEFGLTFEKNITITILDQTPPSVTINKQVGQSDPTHYASVTFLVTFSEPVADFTAADVTISGTAPGAYVKKITGSGKSYEVQVAGMTGSGTVIASIAEGKAHDAAGNASLVSTSTDNSVQYAKEWAIYNGTGQGDAIVFSPGATPGTWQVMVNSMVWTIANGMQGINLEGYDGFDTLRFSGIGGSETFELWPDHAVFKSGTFEMDATNIESFMFDGSGGSPTIILHDGANPGMLSMVNTAAVKKTTLNDFNGDGTSDVLWQNQTTGEVGAWLLRNGNYAGWGSIGSADISTWKAVGIGDFNGNGSSDVLWQNQTTGEVGVWFVQNGAYAGWSSLGNMSASTWKVLAIGDLNGNGASDILWQNQTTGEVGTWIINNGANAGWTSFGTMDKTIWKNAGVADLNGDGTMDVLWHNQSTGEVGAWILHNGNNAGWASLGTANAATWQISGLGDFNGDGTADVLWRNQSTGETGIWFVRYGAYAGWNSFGAVSLSAWKTTAIADFNGDGTADISWQNQTNGEFGIWFIRNGGYAGWNSFGNPSLTTWKPAGRDGSGSFLLAESKSASSANVSSLTENDLKPIIDEAINRWAAGGLSASAIAKLKNVQFLVADLPGSELGVAEGNQILLDINAAGNGWFVDSTPSLDEEYLVTSGVQKRAIDARALERIDLLTVVEHELGHIAGLDDLDALAENAMNGILGVGVRRDLK